jgi:hypothetical protein
MESQMTARNQRVNQAAAQIPAASASCCDLGQFSETLDRPLFPGGLGETLRINPFASLFAATLVILAPVHAAAQTQTQESISVRDRDRPE